LVAREPLSPQAREGQFPAVGEAIRIAELPVDDLALPADRSHQDIATGKALESRAGGYVVLRSGHEMLGVDRGCLS
jgi:hypothetical protein